jgi:uncharacterized tellurite resistance protein B-like protein
MRRKAPPARLGATVSIRDFLGLQRGQAAPDAGPAMTDSVRRLVRQLDDLPPERARFVAAFAYVLSRVANADRQISEAETGAMERIIVENVNLPEAQAILVVQMAKSQNLLFGGTENFLVTRELKRIATREQKLALLACLFAVSAADRGVSTVEDNTVRQIAAELGLEHADFIEVRRRYRDALSVLARPPEAGGGADAD